jgi:hypothetical protein
MAKRPQRPSTWFEILNERAGEQSVHLEAARKRVFDDWIRSLADRRPPTNPELLWYCKLLLNNPRLIEGPYAPYIFLILQKWFAKTPTPKRQNTSEGIAKLVDWVSLTEKVSVSEARRRVAKAFRMTVEAVNRSHQRHRKSGRDKSR